MLKFEGKKIRRQKVKRLVAETSCRLWLVSEVCYRWWKKTKKLSSSKLYHLNCAVAGLLCGKKNGWCFEIFRLLRGFVFGNQSFDQRCEILSFDQRVPENFGREG